MAHNHRMSNTNTNTATTTEFDRGFRSGYDAALRGFHLDPAYTGAWGAGYAAGWTAATS